MNWQPHLYGALIRLRPLTEGDFDALFQAGSDPLIWEQHPDTKRYTRERFEVYFRSGIESQGALAILDQKTGEIIGSSRFTKHDPKESSIEVGYTFVTRPYWGQGHNHELKLLMLGYAFQHVENVFFFVGETNLRSQKAMANIGCVEFNRFKSPDTVVFQMTQANWTEKSKTLLPHFEQPTLTTSRMRLEPVTVTHAEELREFFSDPELHHYVPFEPLSLEQMREKCAKWARRRSPDGGEVWLNWVGREKTSGQVMAHFQSGLKPNGTASIGYVVARKFHGQGFAKEGTEAVLSYLKNSLHAREARAWSDTRNEASHRVAKSLGMTQVDFIKDADFFKGATSDEFVFSKVLNP